MIAPLAGLADLLFAGNAASKKKLTKIDSDIATLRATLK